MTGPRRRTRAKTQRRQGAKCYRDSPPQTPLKPFPRCRGLAVRRVAPQAFLVPLTPVGGGPAWGARTPTKVRALVPESGDRCNADRRLHHAGLANGATAARCALRRVRGHCGSLLPCGGQPFTRAAASSSGATRVSCGVSRSAPGIPFLASWRLCAIILRNRKRWKRNSCAGLPAWEQGAMPRRHGALSVRPAPPGNFPRWQ